MADTFAKYDASNIQILEGLEAVKKRPGMYIGTTGPRGLHHLVWEIVDNSVDEALAGYADSIHIEILPGNIIRVQDNGRGIPVDIHPKSGRPTVETVYTVLHAGGKFDHKSYKVSGGLHGVGASVVNALSKFLHIEIHKDGKIYAIEFEHGFVTKELECIGDTQSSGTVVTFLADPETFTESQEYEFETLRNRIQQLAFLNKGIQFMISDERNPENKIHKQYRYEGGVKEYVEFLNAGKDLTHPMVAYFEGEQEAIMVEIAMQYNNGYAANIYPFTNNITNPEGGTHEEGFKSTLTRILNNYGKNYNIFRKDESLLGEDTREGLVAIVSVKHPDPQFEGQTKSKLGSSDARRVVSNIMSEGLDRFLLENPAAAKMILEKALMAQRARLAAKKARELTRRKSPLDSLGFASKLADCRSKDAQKSEIYIVEGDSAGGSAKQGRDSEYQAILPLRGKVLNVERARLDKALQNKEILSMIQAFGTGISEDFQIEHARYHKIIIMTDADVDGAHIRTLLLTFFFRYMRPLIEKGYVYIAQPPLFKIQQGKQIQYAYDEKELDRILQETSGKPTLQRYKGLGEMNPEQLWDTTMDPDTRTLLQVTLEDAIEADRIFSMLMGDDVPSRKEFIQENAEFVRNLDY
ncbi:MAG: DNA topoisomerase (ATP-hydrolyzing) subunit B [Candidatus Izemoplasmatales bacterium]|jgi:DNA gyrase subunit B|nr:DNA topoisomerase (ATP-hydrolyzing) subunit B [Candidatus Izemoplasmatales bacterium]